MNANSKSLPHLDFIRVDSRPFAVLDNPSARILAAKARDAGADVSAWEREIDPLVYALYGLTPKEIQIVEGAAK